MKTIIVIFASLAFIGSVKAKPTDNEELLSELKKILDERYEERKSQRVVGSTDGSSTSGTEGTGGSDATGGTGGTGGADATGGTESDANAIEELEQQYQQQHPEAGEEQQQEEIEEAEQGLDNGEGEGGEEEEEGEQLDEENENSDSETDTSDVKSLMQKGWDMLNSIQRVSIALHLENNPIKDNKSPREALHDVLSQMFKFDGLAQRVIRELLHSLSPEKDVCKAMFSDGEERTLERVTNCFMMRFTQLLSLIKELQKVTSVEKLKVKDLISLTVLEREMLAASYEVYKILKKEDPKVSLSDFLSGLLSPEGENTNPSETETVEDSTGTGESGGTQEQGSDSPGEGTAGTDEGSSSPASTGSDTANPAGGAGNTEGQEGSSASKRVVKEDLLDRLASKLEELLHKRP